MAQLSFSGLDELMLSMQEIAEIPAEVQDEMLNAGADVVVQAQRRSAEAFGVQDTGLTIDSIVKGKVKLKSGQRAIYIYPQGTRVRGVDEKGKPIRVRNAEIAFINEYGTQKQPARPFILQANEASAADMTNAEAEVYDRFLKSKGL